jgi:2-desacetyl-2-hydroxyethyl bacteriochlorophyllide A dehydrogenase
MKAAVFHSAHNITIEEVPYPRLEPDGVIMKVKACGVCGSDLHLYRHGGRDGTIMGHEFSGDIVEVGNEVAGVKKGDRFVAMSGRGCGQCYFCKQGQFIRCSKLIFLGYGIQGAFAEYVSVPNFKLDLYCAKLPDTLTYEEGATAEPLAVALYAVTQTQPKPEDTVVVIGLGIIGLCIVQILKSMGVTKIIASGRREKRLQMAKEGGADVVVDAAQEDIVPVVEKESPGKGADIVFECAGSPATFQQAIRIVHRGSKINLVGLYQEPITWSPTFLVGNDITLIGCGLRWDLPGAIDLLKSGKVDTKPMITHEFPLDKTKEAFNTQLESKDAIKVLVKP